MLQDLKFAFHILFHPFNGFWDMKHEKKGRLWLALLFVFLYGVTNVIRAEVTGFLFNETKFQMVDLLFELEKVGVLFILVCTANWSVTTLMDGEGTFKDIVMVFGYSCLPMILIQIPAAFLSNLASYSESAYIGILNVGAVVWFLFLLYFGIMTVHQYSLSKMFVTALLTVAAAAVLVFVYLLFFSLLTQMGTFLATLYKELAFRL
ncbi:MAG: YIP1 family protein [Ruminococcaceae bacterium]|nr:YIP1 family protein [Oscillospiraceae bacterium]